MLLSRFSFTSALLPLAVPVLVVLLWGMSVLLQPGHCHMILGRFLYSFHDVIMLFYPFALFVNVCSSTCPLILHSSSFSILSLGVLFSTIYLRFFVRALVDDDILGFSGFSVGFTERIALSYLECLCHLVFRVPRTCFSVRELIVLCSNHLGVNPVCLVF